MKGSIYQMKKRFLSLILAIVMAITVLPNIAVQAQDNSTIWDGSIATNYDSGSGTESDPYIIKTAAQLAYLAQQVSKGETYEKTYFVLGADIVLNDISNYDNWNKEKPNNKWLPIGYTDWVRDGDSSLGSRHPFCGFFDGNNHNIIGLYINAENKDVGLFGCTGGASIKNVSVVKSYICISSTQSSSMAGGIIGYAYNWLTADNCISYCKIDSFAEASCSNRIGGIVGSISTESTKDSMLEHCANYGNIYGDDENGYDSSLGGIVGQIGTTGNVFKIDQCHNCGNISLKYLKYDTENGSNYRGYVGGIIGACLRYSGSSHTINNSFNSGKINITGNDNVNCFVGGIVGRSASYNTTNYIEKC